MPDALAVGRPQSARPAQADSPAGGGDSAVAAAMSKALGDVSERRARARANAGVIPDLSTIEHQVEAAAAATRAWDQARAPREREKNEDSRDAERRAAARIKRSNAAKREVSSLRRTLRQTQPVEDAEQMLASVLRAKEAERRREQSAAGRLAGRPETRPTATAADASAASFSAAALRVAGHLSGEDAPGCCGGSVSGGGGGQTRESEGRVQRQDGEEETGGAAPPRQATDQGDAAKGGDGAAAAAATDDEAAAAPAPADEEATGGDTPDVARPDTDAAVQDETMAESGTRPDGGEPPAVSATWDWIRSPPKHRPTPRLPQTRRVKVHGVWIDVDEEED